MNKIENSTNILRIISGIILIYYFGLNGAVLSLVISEMLRQFYYISTYLKFLQYDKVMALLIVLFFVVVIIDFLSIKARSYFVDDVSFKYPSFFQNILRRK